MNATAPAKIILFGEHAVVYGQPAIAVPVSGLRATATFLPGPNGSGLQIRAADLGAVLPVDIESGLVDNALSITARMVLHALGCAPPDGIINIESTIPMASGLGSGAAVTTALARALALAVGASFDSEELSHLVYEVEKIYHGTPSGIDNTVIVYEKPVYFVRNQPLEILSIGKPFTVIIGDTGQSALTRVAVGDVRKLVESQPERFNHTIGAIGEIARRARAAIELGQTVQLGPLMNENHHLLQGLTVSSPELDTLVQAALDAGAYGAKLSGGGRGGNMIALAPEDRIEAIQEGLIRAGAAHVFVSVVGLC